MFDLKIPHSYALILWLSAALAIPVVESRLDAASPNVLFIAIDDMNDWAGCLRGHPQVKTPHMDRLAERGTLFSNAHCQAPLCNPSRTSVMTGLRPSTTGVYGLRPWFRESPELASLVPLPRYFAKQGYHTLATGKVFHGHFGLRDKDDEFDVVGPRYDDGPRPPQRLAKLPGKASWNNDWGAVPGSDEARGDWRTTTWAVERLDEFESRSTDKPFFLSVGIRLPHVPLFATQKWFELYPESTKILPPVLRDDRADVPDFAWYLHWDLPEQRLPELEAVGEWRSLVRAYLACISFLDSQVGRLLDAVERNGLQDNTIIVLWSDHGWHLGEKLITGKNTLWERSTRVPLIFAGPGIARGDCREPVELLDIYPTLIEVCGLPAKVDIEGTSLLEQLRNATAVRQRPAITTANQNNHAVRSKRWRYIRYADGSEELYDMKSDPNEWHNLANNKDFADVVRQHRSWLPEKNVPPVAGSKGRVLTYDDGEFRWEGKVIEPGSKVPGF